MKKVNKKDLETLRTEMYRALGDNAPNLYDDANIDKMDRMISLARQHRKLAEAYCNGDLTDKQINRQEAIESKIKSIVKDLGLTVKFEGDPRGCTVKLHAPKANMYNTWGGEESGYGI